MERAVDLPRRAWFEILCHPSATADQWLEVGSLDPGLLDEGDRAWFRNDVVTGPGGSQILLEDPSGNVVELFQPAGT